MGKHNEASASFLFHLCFSIFSHPIYFSYFIFFSPYILKLISFLSPLFITTTLLLLALLTAVSPNNYYILLFDKNEFSNSKLGSLIHWLQSKATTTDHKDEEIIGCLEEFEAYLVMFQASIFQALEVKSGEIISFSSPSFEVEANGSINPEGNKSLEILFQENNEESEKEVKAPPPPTPLESLFFQECEGFEDLAHQKGENEANPKDPDWDKGKSEEGEEESKVKLGSISRNEGSRSLDAKGEMKEENNEGMKRVESKGGKLGLISRNGIKMKVNYNNKSQRFLEASLGSPENNWVYNEGSLGSFGSMRKEKEWRRTLACKLFEERHNNNNNKNINININNNNNNINGSEGMDSLWETYDETELDSNKKKVLEKSKTKKGKKSNSNSGVLYYNEEDEEDQNEEDEEEEGMDGKLCCLQALKFSAGKMNLGMGRPNLMKISKAFKGIGWLHHVGKHGSRSKG